MLAAAPPAPERDEPELAAKRRLDVDLVARGLAGSRSEAGALIAAGRVLVGGAVADKASRLVSASEAVVVASPPARFASRGGEKIDAALEHFAVDATGKTALDAGASTGGFTDCLLQRGAVGVSAVDVGYGQLLPRLRQDPRVRVVERANIRHLSPTDFGGERFDIVVADLSFISLMLVAGPLVSLAKPLAELLVLVKPQFEAGRAVVSKGKGVVRDPRVWAVALCDVAGAFEAAGASVVGGMTSPLLGAQGNVEFFLYMLTGQKRADGGVALDELASSALSGVGPGGRP
ncbi:MAG TPA: TlyA family RNA methyltransferase [Acidimicrobiales bacterium]|nr:TlyA family RNA methyltransferase [Acidimicrobiales bacterium]